MKLSASLRLISCTLVCPVVLLTGLSTSVFAGPHHFQKWIDGEIIAIDPHTQRFTLHSSHSKVEAHFGWDQRTRWFRGVGQRALPAAEIPTAALAIGQHARVLYQNFGKERVAQRIVLAPLALHAAK